MDEIKVYSTASDKLVPVTQKWCDDSFRALNLLARQRTVARNILNLNMANLNSADLINKIEQELQAADKQEIEKRK